MMKRNGWGMAAGIALALSCATAPMAEVPRVATDIAPVQSLVARVMAGLGVPSVVVRPGASPHGYALRPSEARALQDADAVFWIGPALEPWLHGTIDTLASGADVTALLDAPGTMLLELRTGATFATHDDTDHDHGDAHGRDPHAWLDPENGKVWLDVIAARLSALDPANTRTYRANAREGRAEIAATEAAIRTMLAPLRDLRFVVFHDAYHYFEHRFGLSAAGAIALGDASAPGPARVAQLRRTVAEMHVTCVFSEPEFNQTLVRTIIDGTTARAEIIDPLGTGIPPGPDFYPALLREVAGKLADCAG